MRLLFVFVFLSSVAFGQSKKTQIESLNKRVDSLNYVLEAERKLSKQQIDKANQNLQEANKKSTDKITKLNRDITRLKDTIKLNKVKYLKQLSELKNKTIINDSIFIDSNIFNNSLAFIFFELRDYNTYLLGDDYEKCKKCDLNVDDECLLIFNNPEVLFFLSQIKIDSLNQLKDNTHDNIYGNSCSRNMHYKYSLSLNKCDEIGYDPFNPKPVHYSDGYIFKYNFYNKSYCLIAFSENLEGNDAGICFKLTDEFKLTDLTCYSNY